MLVPVLSLALSSSVALAQPAADAMLPGYESPEPSWRTVEDADAALACADRIREVREASGQMKLDRGTAGAGAGEPLLIAAVDKRIDGCAVLQMKGDVKDVRPIPEAKDDASLQPSR